jgi:pimeloyl-ACP methyl ester carboxylesterase
MTSPRIGAWRDDEAEHRFRAMEDEVWGGLGLPDPVPLDVATFAGPTHVHRWPGDGEPIVFLHGMGGTGLTWARYVEQLAGSDVYAVDTIGDVGRSHQDVVLADRADLARWLDETLAAAGVEHAHLVGTSYGGYLALNLAARSPARVASLTLIDAGGLAPFRLARFMLWGLTMLFGAIAPDRVRRRLARTRPMLENPKIMRMALAGQTTHRFGLPKPDPLPDHELAAVAVPTTVVVAGHSAPFSPTIAAQRATLIPGAVVDVVPGAGHEVSWTHVDRCVAHVPARTRD